MSSGECTTSLDQELVENLGWFQPAECLAWTVVEVDVSVARHLVRAVDMMTVIRALIAEGWQITAEDLAQLSPYLVSHIRRFGAYATDELDIPPGAFDPALAEVDFGEPAAA